MMKFSISLVKLNLTRTNSSLCIFVLPPCDSEFSLSARPHATDRLHLEEGDYILSVLPKHLLTCSTKLSPCGGVKVFLPKGD